MSACHANVRPHGNAVTRRPALALKQRKVQHAGLRQRCQTVARKAGRSPHPREAGWWPQQKTAEAAEDAAGEAAEEAAEAEDAGTGTTDSHWFSLPLVRRNISIVSEGLSP
eukprot:gene16574-biopygen771